MAYPEVKMKTVIEPEIVMDVREAIRRRKAVRSYKPQPVLRAVINTLLSAAIQTPTATQEEPWAFAVIQDKALLEQLSGSVKRATDSATLARLSDYFIQQDFNIFYNAETLIVVYGRPIGRSVEAECWLAAENLILTASSMRLGTCVIELAIQTLNTPEWKDKLGIDVDMKAYVSLTVGVPDVEILPVLRKGPEIVVWK